MENKKYKLLVVEDEGLIAADLAKRLAGLGHEVIAIAETAAEAVEKAPGADLVLMDIRLEGPGDGIDAAARIREQCRVPVIFLTSHTDRATLERAKLTGPFGFLVKPVGQGALQTAIEIGIYRHALERQLEEREAWLAAVLGSISDAVVAADPAGRIRTLNPLAESLTGWTRSEAAGEPLTSILPLTDASTGETPGDPVAVAILRDSGVTLGRDTLLKTRDGNLKSVEGSAAPVKARGQIIGVALCLRDVTARRWEERQVRQAQKLEVASRLAAELASEYANLLATVHTRARILLDRFRGYEPVAGPLEEIERAAEAAEEITRRLAAFAAPHAARREPVSLNAIVRGMRKLIESIAADHATVTVRLEPHPGRIRADAAQVEQAIMNLVLHSCAAIESSARDASDPKQAGRLWIETGVREVPELGSFVRLTVRHNGPAPDVEALFEPAATGDGSAGLALAHGIVVEHDGMLSAEAEGESGCRFDALFPRWSGAESDPSANPPSGNLLLIEPRAQVRAELHNFFEAHGYNLIEAADVAEAAALCEIQFGAEPNAATSEETAGSPEDDTEGAMEKDTEKDMEKAAQKDTEDESSAGRGSIDLVIAEPADAARIAAAFPALPILGIVEGPVSSPHEIHKLFTQKELLERVRELLPAGPDAQATSA